jgi:hypothetical protein
MKIYTLISIIALLPSICFSQWVIDNSKDDFEQNKRVYSNNYDQSIKGECTYPTVVEILPSHNLEIYTGCGQEGTNWWYITLIVNGQPKEYSFTGGSSEYSVMINTPPTALSKASCVLYCTALKDMGFYMDFAQATKMSIKVNCFPHKTNYFSMNLKPSNTESALNFIFNGEYNKIKNEQLEKDKLQKEQEKQKQIQKENIYNSIINNLKDRNVKEAKANLNNLKAILGYDFSEKKYTDLELMVKNQESNNILDVQTFLNADKIDEAINLLKITSDNQSYQENIRIALMKKLPEPMKLLPNSEINSLLQGFEETLTPIFKNNSNETLTLFINKLGNCEIKNEKGEVKTTFKCGAQYIAINDYHGIKYNVDSKYSLKTYVNKEVGKVVGINLGQAFLKYKGKIENKELLFFHTKDLDGTMILFVNKEDAENIKKYDEVSEIIEVKIVDEIIGKKAKFIISCPLKINDQFFTEINILSDLEINRFKKL